MDDLSLRLQWMRATLRLICRADVATFSDEEVIESFACLRDRPLPYELWAMRLGRTAAPAAPEQDASPEALIAHAKATAPNLTVEVNNG